jgi:hypothetical protein
MDSSVLPLGHTNYLRDPPNDDEVRNQPSRLYPTSIMPNPDHEYLKPTLSPSPSIHHLVLNQSRPAIPRCTSPTSLIDYPNYPPRSSSLSHKSIPIRCRVNRDSIHSSSNISCFSSTSSPLSPSPSISRHSRSAHLNRPTLSRTSTSSRPSSPNWLSRTPNYGTPRSSRMSVVSVESILPVAGGGRPKKEHGGEGENRRNRHSRTSSMSTHFILPSNQDVGIDESILYA